jgi:hypothetical protein
LRKRRREGNDEGRWRATDRVEGFVETLRVVTNV